MIIILGGSGYVGQAFCNYFHDNKIPYKSISRKQHDYSTVDNIGYIIRKYSGTFLINAAGYTGKPNVDACENDKDVVWEANVNLPSTIHKACKAQRIEWGHVSSGCIYSGKRDDGLGWKETDRPNFTESHYSNSKACAELLIDGAYIWRLRMPFDDTRSKRNLLQKLKDYDKLIDAENSLTYLPEFVEACYKCSQLGKPGIYNIVNPGSITTKEIVEMMGLEKEFFNSIEEFEKTVVAKRSNCVLDNTKILSLGIKLTEVHKAVGLCLSSDLLKH